MITNTGYGRYATNEYDVVMKGNILGPNYGKVVIYCHAANDATGTELLSIVERRELLLGLTNSGFTIIAPQLGGANTWGNPTSQTQMDNAYNYAVSLFPSITSVTIVGQSMGSLVGTVWASNNLTKVDSLVGIVPVIDLEYTYSLPAFTADINAAYGGSYNPSTNGLGRNPIKLAEAGSISTLRTQLWAALEDTVSPASIVRDYDELLPMTEVNYFTGQHTEDSVGKVNVEAVLAFV